MMSIFVSQCERKTAVNRTEWTEAVKTARDHSYSHAVAHAAIVSERSLARFGYKAHGQRIVYSLEGVDTHARSRVPRGLRKGKRSHDE